MRDDDRTFAVLRDVRSCRGTIVSVHRSEEQAMAYWQDADGNPMSAWDDRWVLGEVEPGSRPGQRVEFTRRSRWVRQ